ncbi:MAG: GNAT family N-acetyltransferase [Selenomonadaceae bacterium]|nr:GNAT family N-acetyltransferase [Selenomonadaceae bacterium]MBQ6131549.1 GNAT family N-acetyltransferase [Selenomonadaceae bacterium]MBQ7493987.1 GNAT family N-acetyltransferase [Selenomonadaceae bacterium]
MAIEVVPYDKKFVGAAIKIWNEIVREGIAFPQEDEFDEITGDEFFQAQSFTGLAVDGGEVLALYILHPNNVGRCAHISNASYAVRSDLRGRHIGEIIVKDCIARAKELGFRILQFNAVVATNIHARHLYQRLGFKELGTIPGGFRMPDGSFEDIVPQFIGLT